MEKNKIKIKYLMSFWKALSEYPTREDVLYEISYYLEKDERTNLEFSDTTLEFVFRNNTEEEKKTIEGLIRSLKESEDIVFIKTTGEDKNWYKIKEDIFN